jgi:hypothetical protein
MFVLEKTWLNIIENLNDLVLLLSTLTISQSDHANTRLFDLNRLSLRNFVLKFLSWFYNNILLIWYALILRHRPVSTWDHILSWRNFRGFYRLKYIKRWNVVHQLFRIILFRFTVTHIIIDWVIIWSILNIHPLVLIWCNNKLLFWAYHFNFSWSFCGLKTWPLVGFGSFLGLTVFSIWL